MDKFADVVKSAKEKLPLLFPRLLFDELKPDRALDGQPQPTGIYRPKYTKKRAACLFVDVSGFTLVSKQLQNRYGEGEGAEKLSQCINSFFGLILSSVKTYGGDVMFFSGDAVMVCWFANIKEEDDCVFQRACISCVACGAEVFPLTCMVDELSLNVHLGASCGYVYVMSVGGYQPSAQGRMKFLVIGDPIAEAGVSASIAMRSQFVLHHSLVKECPKDSLNTITLQDLSCVQFVGVKQAFPPVKRNSVETLPDIKGLDKMVAMFSFDAMLRQSMKTSSGEIRTVSTVFINLVKLNNTNMEVSDLHEQLQGSFSIVQRLLKRYEGICNKLIMDDKGLIALIVFGLPGYVHEDDALRSLMFALKLSRKMNKKMTHSVVIGVSRAPVFLGCCGSSEWRYEYTVLGDGVNIAARLMGHAKGQTEEHPTSTSSTSVVCDAETLHGIAHCDDISFGECAQITVKNRPEPLQIFFPQFISSTARLRSCEGTFGPMMKGKMSSSEDSMSSTSDFDDTLSQRGGSIDDGPKIEVQRSSVSKNSDIPKEKISSIEGDSASQRIRSRSEDGDEISRRASASKVGKSPIMVSDLENRRRSSSENKKKRSRVRATSRTSVSMDDSSLANTQKLEVETLPMLCGREAELNFIERHLLPLQKKANSRVAHNMFLSVVGDSGSGKTTLMHHVLHLLRSKNFPLHVLHGEEFLSCSAFGAMKKYLKFLVKHRSIDSSWFLAEFDTEEVELLPVLANLIDIPDLQGQGNAALTAGQANKMNLVNKLILNVFRHTVTGLYVLLIDDFQWLDPLTASFVIFAVRHKVPTIVFRRELPHFLSYRHESDKSFHNDFDLHSLGSANSDESINLDQTEIDSIIANLRALFNETSSIRVDLRALSKDAFSSALLSALGCTDIASELLDNVYSKSDGNVGFAREILRNFIENGKIRIDNSKAVCMGDYDVGAAIYGMTSVQAVMMKTIDNLSEPLQVLLGLCSVLGTRFDVRILTQCYIKLCGGATASENNVEPSQTEQEITTMLDELVDQGLLILAGKTLSETERTDLSVMRLSVTAVSTRKSVSGGISPRLIGKGYRFKRLLMRDVVYQKILSTERRRIHTAVVTVFSAIPKLETWKLAYHVARSGDNVRAVSLLQVSVQESRTALDPHFTLKHLRDISAIMATGQIHPHEYNGYSIQRHKRLILECECDLREERDTIMMLSDALSELGHVLNLSPNSFDLTMVQLGQVFAEMGCCKAKRDDEIALLYLLAAESAVADNHVICTKWCLIRALAVAVDPNLIKDLGVTASIFNYITSGGASRPPLLDSSLLKMELNSITANYVGLRKTPQSATSDLPIFRRMTGKFVATCDKAALHILLAEPARAYGELESLLKLDHYLADRHVSLTKTVHCYALCLFRHTIESTAFTQQSEVSKIIATIALPEHTTVRLQWLFRILHLISDVRCGMSSTTRALKRVTATIPVIMQYPMAIDTLAYTCLLEALFTELEKFRSERAALVTEVLAGLQHQQKLMKEIAGVTLLFWEGMYEYVVQRKKALGRAKWEEAISLAKSCASGPMLDEMRSRYCLAVSEHPLDVMKKMAVENDFLKTNALFGMKALFSPISFF